MHTKIMFIFLILNSTVFITHQNDQNYFEFIDKIQKMFDLTTDYKFNSETNYPPIAEDVTFWVISPGKTKFKQIYINDTWSTIKTHILLNRPIGFLIHGWTDSFIKKSNDNSGIQFIDDSWMDETARYWSTMNKQSVICVDWNRLANYEYLIAAQENTKLVGKFIGQFITDCLQIQKQQSSNESVHLDNITIVGHSLGGQIAGFTGQKLNGKLGQIIALDPAGPLFTYPTDMGLENRLDANDAKFIQVLHTSCGSLGVQINCGHADYYVNGGVIQPGCFQNSFFQFGEIETMGILTCSHMRATEYFKSSCNPNNNWFGIQCEGEREGVGVAMQKQKHFDGCNLAESFISGIIPSLGSGINLLYSTTMALNGSSSISSNSNYCPYYRSDRFGIYSKQSYYGSFDVRITQFNSPYV